MYLIFVDRCMLWFWNINMPYYISFVSWSSAFSYLYFVDGSRQHLTRCRKDGTGSPEDVQDFSSLSGGQPLFGLISAVSTYCTLYSDAHAYTNQPDWFNTYVYAWSTCWTAMILTNYQDDDLMLISAWHQQRVWSFRSGGSAPSLANNIGTEPVFGLAYHLASLQPINGAFRLAFIIRCILWDGSTAMEYMYLRYQVYA